MPSLLAISAAIPCASPCCSRILSTARCRRSGSRAAITTRQPSLLNRSAQANPNPLLPPVIKATFPAIPRSIGSPPFYESGETGHARIYRNRRAIHIGGAGRDEARCDKSEFCRCAESAKRNALGDHFRTRLLGGVDALEDLPALDLAGDKAVDRGA